MSLSGRNYLQNYLLTDVLLMSNFFFDHQEWKESYRVSRSPIALDVDQEEFFNERRPPDLQWRSFTGKEGALLLLRVGERNYSIMAKYDARDNTHAIRISIGMLTF